MPAADYSTPEKAALTYWNAQKYANWTAVRDGAIGPEGEMRRLESRYAAMLAERDLEAASLEKFGPQKDRISDSYIEAAIWDDVITAFSGPDVKVVKGERGVTWEPRM